MIGRRLAALGACLLVAGAWLVAAQQARTQVLSRLTWFDRSGARLGAIGPLADHGNLELSPDGTRVAVAVTDRALNTRDIWIYDTKTGNERTRFTTDPSDENWLIWSGDGRRVVLNSFGTEHLDLFEAQATGIDPHTVLLMDAVGKWPVSWSRDGRFLLFVTNNRNTGNDIWVLPLEGDRRPYSYLRTEASENWAAFSPDGTWVAYSSTESGQIEVYVSPFPSTGRRWRVSADGGSQARWRRDGTEIFYLAPNRMLMAAAVSVENGEVAVKDYEPLFDVSYPYGAYHAFDVTADGQRFLVNTVVSAGSPAIVASR